MEFFCKSQAQSWSYSNNYRKLVIHLSQDLKSYQIPYEYTPELSFFAFLIEYPLEYSFLLLKLRLKKCDYENYC